MLEFSSNCGFDLFVKISLLEYVIEKHTQCRLNKQT